MTDFEPNILAFCCNWCSYAAADLAGIGRMKQPTNVKIVRVMCSGRVKPEFVIKALAEGVDGVLILGCHIGDCHYVTGNHRTKKRFEIFSKLLGHMGIDPRRIRLDWASAAEAIEFAKIISDFTETIKELGPNEYAGKHERATA
jgi:F420-non-reducing hydrogenase iron-sulfur subunit